MYPTIAITQLNKASASSTSRAPRIRVRCFSITQLNYASESPTRPRTSSPSSHPPLCVVSSPRHTYRGRFSPLCAVFATHCPLSSLIRHHDCRLTDGTISFCCAAAAARCCVCSMPAVLNAQSCRTVYRIDTDIPSLAVVELPALTTGRCRRCRRLRQSMVQQLSSLRRGRLVARTDIGAPIRNNVTCAHICALPSKDTDAHQ